MLLDLLEKIYPFYGITLIMFVMVYCVKAIYGVNKEFDDWSKKFKEDKEMTIVGKQLVDYTSKKTNQPVKGVTIHLIGEQNGVEGQAVHTAYISSKSDGYETVLGLAVGTEVKLYYNQWGNVENVVPV